MKLLEDSLSDFQKGNLRELIKAFREGSYLKCNGRLHAGKCFCAEGVACDVSKLGYWEEFYEDRSLSFPTYIYCLGTYKQATGEANYSHMPEEVMEFYGFALREPRRHNLIEYSDGGNTFAEIANVLEVELTEIEKRSSSRKNSSA